MESETIITLGTQIVIVLGVIFAGLAARESARAARIAAETKAETSAQTTKIDTVAKETAVVLGHVNSEKTSDAKTIEFQARENRILREQLQEKDRIAGLLAAAAAAASHIQAAATSPTIVQAPAFVVPPALVPRESTSREGDAADASLRQIDKNTADTAANTARTDAKVDELKGP